MNKEASQTIRFEEVVGLSDTYDSPLLCSDLEVQYTFSDTKIKILCVCVCVCLCGVAASAIFHLINVLSLNIAVHTKEEGFFYVLVWLMSVRWG